MNKQSAVQPSSLSPQIRRRAFCAAAAGCAFLLIPFLAEAPEWTCYPPTCWHSEAQDLWKYYYKDMGYGWR